MLKILMGDPKADRVNYREPVPAANVSEAPEWLTARQKLDWKFKRASSPTGVIKEIDRGALAASCVVDDILRDAAEGYAGQKNKLGRRAQAHLGTVARFVPLAVRLNTELGFSPLARPRLQWTPEPGDKSDFEKLIG